MIWVRKGFVHLLSVILFASLIGGVAALNFHQVLGSPTEVKRLVAQSGIYNKLAASALDQAEKTGSGDGSVNLNDPAVKAAASQAFTPQLLQQTFETFIDANYAWLEGKTATPRFSIDLSGAKNAFATQVGTAVTAHLKNVPVCTPQQLATLQLPVDPLTIDCRPATLDPQTEGTRVANEVKSNQDFLSQPVLTPDTINQNTKAQGEPYYQSAHRAPSIFKLVQKGALILGALAALTAVGIIFIAPTRRRGLRRVGIVLIEAGAVLVASKFVADSLATRLSNHLQKGAASQFGDQVNTLVHHVEPQLFKYNLWFGAAFVLLGITTLIWLIATREGRSKPKVKAPVADTPNVESDDDSQPINPDDIKLAPPRKEPSPMQKVAAPKPLEPTTAPPLEAEEKTPPKPKSSKKPPLIQG